MRKAVDRLEARDAPKVFAQADPVLRSQAFFMAVHEGRETPVCTPLGIEPAPGAQEVVVDQADHVEAVRDDQGSGKCFRISER